MHITKHNVCNRRTELIKIKTLLLNQRINESLFFLMSNDLHVLICRLICHDVMIIVSLGCTVVLIIITYTVAVLIVELH